MQWMLVVVFLIALGLNIYALKSGNKVLAMVTKPLLTISLLLFYIWKAEKPDSYVIAALLAGLAGDVFLMLPGGNGFFLAGLFSFLIGHLSYILAFLETSGWFSGLGAWFYLLAIPYVVLGAFILARLAPFTGKLLPGVAGYVITIVCMGISSLTSLKIASTPAFLFAIAGGLLFIVSDACLATSKFKKTKERDGTVMLTYGFAQLFLTLWFSAL